MILDQFLDILSDAKIKWELQLEIKKSIHEFYS